MKRHFFFFTQAHMKEQTEAAQSGVPRKSSKCVGIAKWDPMQRFFLHSFPVPVYVLPRSLELSYPLPVPLFCVCVCVCVMRTNRQDLFDSKRGSFARK